MITKMANTVQKWLRSHIGESKLVVSGLYNPVSGLGTPGSDKVQGTVFSPTRIAWAGELETIYVESWAARKLIDLPVDDILRRWRVWDNIDKNAITRLEEVEKNFHVHDRLMQALKAARLYGTSLLVLRSREAPLDTPLIWKHIQPGDGESIAVYNRYQVSFDGGFLSRGEKFYRIPQEGPSFSTSTEWVHTSRLIRFDGIESLSSQGFLNYDPNWGVSLLVPAMRTLLEDALITAGAAHLSQEASIPVLKLLQLRDAMVGFPEAGDPTPEQYAAQFNAHKGNYRLAMIDKVDELDRVEVNFNGWPALMDQFALRLAASADIPATRFLGRSPAGMNATGKSDTDNYFASLESVRDRALGPSRLLPLDGFVTRLAGLKTIPAYTWPSIRLADPLHDASIASEKVKALVEAVTAGFLDEDEARQRLHGDPVFGSLPQKKTLPEWDLGDDPT